MLLLASWHHHLSCELMSSPLLTGDDNRDGASWVGSGAGISAQGHPLGAHPHPRNLLLDSGLSPRVGDRDTPKGSLPSAPDLPGCLCPGVGDGLCSLAPR